MPGATLTIPAGRWHLVRAGETGIAIARAYRADFAVVARVNGLRAPYALEIGDLLLIPPPPPRATLRFTPVARAKIAAPAPAPAPATVEARAQAYNLDIDKLLRGEPQARRAAPRSSEPASELPPPSREAAPSRAGEGAGSAGRTAAEGATIHLDWPLTGHLLSTFGAKPGGRFNDGVNIAAAPGTPVHAAASGIVLYAGNGVPAFGNLVLVRHADGWLTAYAHCATLLVTKGDRVTGGQPIATAGATGEVDTPQLHFEVRRGRKPVDPLGILGPSP